MAGARAADDLRAALDGLPVRVVDAGGVWGALRIGRAVPLGRLEWLWTLRGASVRDSSTAARAVFNVARAGALSEPAAPRLAHEWFRRAYLHVLLVTLAELQVSRESPGWSRVRAFVDASRELRHEYLVVCVADDAAVRAHRKVLEKLRAEVNLNTRGRERVVTVPPAPPNDDLKPISHLHHSPAHQDLLVRLRECARDGVEARVQAYEAEAARQYVNRSAPRWSFTSYFAVKEGMSFVFVQIGRRDLALKCYDELAAVMADRDERGVRPFSTSPTVNDTAGSIVDPYAKDFRRMAIDGDITELDLRNYLFARQASLLLVDRKYSEVAERGLKFITVVARRSLEEASAENSTLSPVFRDAWVFRAARSLAAALAPAIPPPPSAPTASKQLGTARERHTARLIAGFHVHALKAFSGLAQLAVPGTLVVSMDPADGNAGPVSTDVQEALAGLSNELLQSALSEPAKAVELYSEMANAAASLYEMGGRARGAAALDGDAGVVRLRNKSLVEAEELLSAQCSRFTEDHGWDQLHRRRRVELAIAEKSLNRVQEYLVSCLTMLFMTRERRRLGLLSETPDHDLEFYSKEAARWAAEAKTAAGQLPRVMKYKAEKLLLLSLRSNKEQWNEGDPGSATVVIESDIPTTLLIDSVYVEMRWSPLSPGDGSSRRPLPSALHRPETNSAANDELTSSASSSISTADAPESLTLRCGDPISVGPGTTLATVRTPEVPRCGKYSGTMIALVVGRLKLVQSAVKSPTVPTVATKGSSHSKVPSAVLAASAAQSDLPISSKARFPCFFSMPRPEAVTICLDQNSSLYFLPNVTQHVRIVLTAGPSGIRLGAKLSVSIAPVRETSTASHLCVSVVQHQESPLTLTNSSGATTESSVALTDVTARDAELMLTTALSAGETCEIQIPVQVIYDASNPCSCLGNVSTDGHSCEFNVALACAELTSQRQMSLFFQKKVKLRFVPSLLLSSKIELSSAGDEIPGPPSTTVEGGLGSPVFGGGVLLCSLRSQAGLGKSVTLVSAELELPPWLELASSNSLAHESLLPFSLRNSGLFTIAFDTSICTQPADRQSTRQTRLDERAKERMLSRLTDTLDVEVAESQVDTASGTSADSGKNGAVKESGGRLQAHFDPAASAIDLEEASLTGMRKHAAGKPSIVDSGTVSAVSLEQVDVDDDDRLTDGRHNAAESDRLGPSRGTARAGSLQGSRLRDSSGEVVDLSDNTTSFEMMTSPNDRQPLSRSDATLRVRIEMDGLPGQSTLEFPISMVGFRPQRRRYRVEPSCQSTATVGERIVLRFQVSPLTMLSFPDEEVAGISVLHYEVDTNPTEWLLAGRRRGQMVVSEGEGGMGEVTLVPLTPGRLYVPSLHLFSKDGAPLSSSRYDNVNKGGQVTVLPPSRILSPCNSDPIPSSALKHLSAAGERRRGMRRAAPVATVPSDRFFGH